MVDHHIPVIDKQGYAHAPSVQGVGTNATSASVHDTVLLHTLDEGPRHSLTSPATAEWTVPLTGQNQSVSQAVIEHDRFVGDSSVAYVRVGKDGSLASMAGDVSWLWLHSIDISPAMWEEILTLFWTELKGLCIQSCRFVDRPGMSPAQLFSQEVMQVYGKTTISSVEILVMQNNISVNNGDVSEGCRTWQWPASCNWTYCPLLHTLVVDNCDSKALFGRDGAGNIHSSALHTVVLTKCIMPYTSDPDVHPRLRLLEAWECRLPINEYKFITALDVVRLLSPTILQQLTLRISMHPAKRKKKRKKKRSRERNDRLVTASLVRRLSGTVESKRTRMGSVSDNVSEWPSVPMRTRRMSGDRSSGYSSMTIPGMRSTRSLSSHRRHSLSSLSVFSPLRSTTRRHSIGEGDGLGQRAVTGRNSSFPTYPFDHTNNYRSARHLGD